MVALNAAAGALRRREAGQALVETALVVPVLLLFLSAVVDVGRFMFIESNVGSAADALARQIESTPDLTQRQAREYLDATFPSLADGAQVTLGERASETERIGYRVYHGQSASFKVRPSEVSWEKVSVTVDFDGWWLNPGLVVAGELLTGDGGFHISRTSQATLDTTLETW